MCDQCLFLGQFQLEFIAQELSQALFDLLGLGFRSRETQEVVVRVAYVTQPAICRIAGIRARQADHPLTQLAVTIR
ncbi:hypothetical protein IGW14_23240 [Streptomyces hygroscopicus subsp. hygroscopicus]|uniref:hypothetical protein n=1 Tax=Streptomyces hygroscopicus TaxID=1912 RepID=UPI001C66050F|nr:hypothetical protein [Streptomyces hygroscopicus subsp. hygroscopicus]